MITEDRQKHIFGVANFLKNYTIRENLSAKDTETLFVLGLLHDIGYEFLDGEDYSKHNFIGGQLLKKQGYKYWKEVYYHGVVNCKYKSKYLDLLNWADMRVDDKGNIVSFEERCESISERYNIPVENLDCYKLICELKEKGYK